MDDYRDDYFASGPLGNVYTGEQISGKLEEKGDTDIFRTVLIKHLEYTITVESTGPDPLGDAFVGFEDKNFNYYGFDSIPVDAWIYPETTGFFWISVYDPYDDEPGYDTVGNYRVKVSSGLGTSSGETIVGTKYGDAVDAGGGNDTVKGGKGADSLAGGTGNDTLLGGGYTDTLYGDKGNDTLRGQGGNDLLIGGDNADILIGGAGSDVFAYRSTGQSRPGSHDTIRAGDGKNAFQYGDKIDVSDIDAKAGVGGNQAFTFGGVIGQNATGSKGYLYVSNIGQDTYVRASTDGDKAWELVIEIEDGGRSASWYDGGDFFL